MTRTVKTGCLILCALLPVARTGLAQTPGSNPAPAPLEIVIKKVSRTNESLLLVTQLTIQGDKVVPYNPTAIEPPSGKTFIQVDVEVVNRTQAEVRFEPSKLLARTAAGDTLILLEQSEGRMYMYLSSLAETGIPGNKNWKEKLLASVGENEKLITLEYTGIIKTVDLGQTK